MGVLTSPASSAPDTNNQRRTTTTITIRLELLTVQGGRSCGSAVAALPERSWSLRKERSSTYGKNFKTTFWRKNLQILHFCRENTNVHSLKLWGFFLSFPKGCKLPVNLALTMKLKHLNYFCICSKLYVHQFPYKFIYLLDSGLVDAWIPPSGRAHFFGRLLSGIASLHRRHTIHAFFLQFVFAFSYPQKSHLSFFPE